MMDFYHRTYKVSFIFLFFFLFISNIIFTQEASILGGKFSANAKSLTSGKLVHLDGEWEFFWDKFLYSDNIINSNPYIKPDSYIKTPCYWNDSVYTFTGKKSSYGVASYRLLVSNLYPFTDYALLINESPGTACKIFANGQLVFEAGKISRNQAEAIPKSTPCYAQFSSDVFGNVEIVIEVSNFFYRTGGLWDSVIFGTQNYLRRYFDIKSGLISFVCSILLFLSCVNIVLFILNTKKKGPLFFAIITSLFALRISISDFCILSAFYDLMSYSNRIKLGYLVIWLAPVAFLWQTKTVFPQLNIPKILVIIFSLLPICLGLISFALPIQYANWFVIPFISVAIAIFIYLMIVITRALLSGDREMPSYILTMLIAGLSLASEVIFKNAKDYIHISLLPILLSIFAVLQFLFLSRQQAKLYSDKKHLSNRIIALHTEYRRYAPKELFKLLGQDDIFSVQPGTFVKTKATVLFLKSVIQGDEQTKFEVFSDFIKKAIPTITGYNGFIATSTETGLTILFNEPTETVMRCCFILQDLVKKYNETRESSILSLYSAIHYGDILAGVTGNKQQIFGTTVSVSVETAYRMALFAQSIRRNCVISYQASKMIFTHEDSPAILIPLGIMTLKWNHKPIQLYEFNRKELFKNKVEVSNINSENERETK